MKVFCVPSGPLMANGYIIYKDKDSGVIIDAGGYGEIAKILEQEKITPKYLLLTHGHFDHCSGAREFQEQGVKVLFHKADDPIIKKGLYTRDFDMVYRPFSADAFFEEKELALGDLTINVIFTPGHTEGSVAFAINDCLFTGDTLFYHNVGRTDLEGGSITKLKESLNKLLALPRDYKVYPGHGQPTNLEIERRFFADIF